MILGRPSYRISLCLEVAPLQFGSAILYNFLAYMEICTRIVESKTFNSFKDPLQKNTLVLCVVFAKEANGDGCTGLLPMR